MSQNFDLGPTFYFMQSRKKKKKKLPIFLHKALIKNTPVVYP